MLSATGQLTLPPFLHYISKRSDRSHSPCIPVDFTRHLSVCACQLMLIFRKHEFLPDSVLKYELPNVLQNTSMYLLFCALTIFFGGFVVVVVVLSELYKNRILLWFALYENRSWHASCNLFHRMKWLKNGIHLQSKKFLHCLCLAGKYFQEKNSVTCYYENRHILAGLHLPTSFGKV